MVGDEERVAQQVCVQPLQDLLLRPGPGGTNGPRLQGEPEPVSRFTPARRHRPIGRASSNLQPPIMLSMISNCVPSMQEISSASLPSSQFSPATRGQQEESDL